MITYHEIFIRLLLAALLGGLIGLERERKELSAGLRTHMMVSLGSSLIMMVSSFGFFDILGSQNVGLDPSRVAAQVVSGIGFIGAGTILFLRGGIVRGLTTASGLWTVAAIGLATGGGLYFAAALTTVIALLILWALPPIVHLFSKKYTHSLLEVVATDRVDILEVLSLFKEGDIPTITSYTTEKREGSTIFNFKFEALLKESLTLTLNSTLNSIPSIKTISWSHE
ncbi:MAG: MgtC/SapB family protein [Bacteroidales bacterium]